MLRWLLAALVATTSGAAAVAQPQPARVPVTMYLVAPADRPDKPTIMTTASPKKAREVKHCAATWCQAELWYFNVGPDCQPSDLETTLVGAPKHGRFDFFETSVPTRGFGNPGFAKDDPRLACPKLPLRSGSYHPDSGFLGRDFATVAFRDGDTTFTEAFEIDVRRPVRPSPLAAVAR
jgi:hypothetical protein